MDDLTPPSHREQVLQEEVTDLRADVVGLMRNITGLHDTIQTTFAPKVEKLEEVAKTVVPRSEHRRRRVEAALTVALFVVGLMVGLLRIQAVANHNNAAQRRTLHTACVTQQDNRTVLRTLIDSSAAAAEQAAAANTDPVLAHAYQNSLKTTHEFQALAHRLLPHLSCP